jgi:cell envelope opacity-associated protein A
MPGRFELTSTLAKIWHAPDHFRLMDPLPPMHRRGIIAGAAGDYRRSAPFRG